MSTAPRPYTRPSLDQPLECRLGPVGLLDRHHVRVIAQHHCPLRAVPPQPAEDGLPLGLNPHVLDLDPSPLQNPAQPTGSRSLVPRRIGRVNPQIRDEVLQRLSPRRAPVNLHHVRPPCPRAHPSYDPHALSSGSMPNDDVLHDFHPLVAEWFRSRFPKGPTDAQQDAWPHIRAGRDTLVAAPTGSGKTLTAFLAGIDVLVREAERGDLKQELRILYISPLKALANDIQRNLDDPLSELMVLARKRGDLVPEIITAVRTGDTEQEDREDMRLTPAHILNTTPESLSVMLTDHRDRDLLRTIDTVIVDEISCPRAI